MDKFVRLGECESAVSSPYVYKWREYSAKVYKCRDTQTNGTVVIKEVPHDRQFKLTPTLIMREIYYFRTRLAHDNIVRLLDKIDSCGTAYLVFENFDHSLRDLIDRRFNFDPDQIKNILRKILLAVAHCHSVGVIHRHLEPKYVLLDLEKDHVKLSEFGEAMGEGLPYKTYNRLSCVAPGYKAPELLVKSRYYTIACDIWSVGCIFGEMVLHDPVFTGNHELEQLFSMFDLLGTPNQQTCPMLAKIWGDMPNFVQKEPQCLETKFKGLEPAGVDLISKMLCLDLSKRISAVDALKHEYFSEVQDVNDENAKSKGGKATLSPKPPTAASKPPTAPLFIRLNEKHDCVFPFQKKKTLLPSGRKE